MEEGIKRGREQRSRSSLAAESAQHAGKSALLIHSQRIMAAGLSYCLSVPPFVVVG